MPERSDHATLPAETAYCHTCGFEHTRRPDWLCPRCGMPAGTEPPPRRPVAASPEKPTFPMGSAIAGVAIAVNGLALLVGFAMGAADRYRWVVLAAGLVLVVLASELLLRVGAGRWIALVAAAVGALIVAEGVVRERVPDLFQDPLPDPVRLLLRDLLGDLRPAGISSVLAFAAGCLLLVVGRPGRKRIAAGVVLAVPLVVLEMIWLFGR